MTAHGVRCKKYGEVIALKLDGAECVCGERCAVFPERAVPSDLPTIVYRTKITVCSHPKTEHSRAVVQILTDDDMRDIGAFSFQPEYADQLCEAIRRAADAATAGEKLEVRFIAESGTN